MLDTRVHRMLAGLKRTTDAEFINRVINHESVKPYVRGAIVGDLYITGFVKDTENVLLIGKHGGVFFYKMTPGLYEAHTQVLPEGRGAWALDLVHAAAHWMFCRTDAVELVTKVPRGYHGARALVRAVGATKEFTAKRGWIHNYEEIPADIYSLKIQDWCSRAPGLRERGAWFHDLLESEYARHGRSDAPHDDDPVHDQYVGAACEMIMGGQTGKGMLFYNRWAHLAGYAQIFEVCEQPLTFNINDAMLIYRGNEDFWMPSVLKKEAA